MFDNILLGALVFLGLLAISTMGYVLASRHADQLHRQNAERRQTLRAPLAERPSVY